MPRPEGALAVPSTGVRELEIERPTHSHHDGGIHARRPRVLLLTPDYPPAKGGIQTLLAKLAEHAHGLDFSVLTLAEPGAGAHDRAQRVPVRRVGRPGHVLPRPVVIAALDAAGVARALRHPPDLVLSGHIVTAPAAAAIERLLGVPFLQYLYAMEMAARPTLTRFAVTRARAVVVLSGYARALALQAGAPPARVHTIPPGIDVPVAVSREPAPHEPPRERAARPTILTVARLRERYKGHDVLIRALPLICARVPDVEWVAIGEGPLRAVLEEQARSLGVERHIRLLGSVSDRERDEWLSRAHVLAMPSRLPGDGLAGEGFGIVFLEAAARGLPVVAGAVGGALDAVCNGTTGLLVDPTDPHAVAAAIVEILRDPARADLLSRRSVEWAERFAWPHIAARFQELALDMISSPLRRARRWR
ncbi:MAG: glycosyltransferase family 4 protein [Solirubrobacterales bacterium]